MAVGAVSYAFALLTWDLVGAQPPWVLDRFAGPARMFLGVVTMVGPMTATWAILAALLVKATHHDESGRAGHRSTISG